MSYTIETVPTEPIVSNYTDGSSVRQYLFVFASREFFSSDLIDNIENSGFYENLASWVEYQTKIANLPDLESNFLKSQKIEVVSNGYVFEEDTSNARYQIQLRLVYYQDRRYNLWEKD